MLSGGEKKQKLGWGRGEQEKTSEGGRKGPLLGHRGLRSIRELDCRD